MTEFNREVSSSNTDSLLAGLHGQTKKAWPPSQEELDRQGLKVREWIQKLEPEREKQRLRECMGWTGKGPYTSKHPAYVPWRNMLQRAKAIYDPKKRAANDPDCWNGVVGEWMDFQNFAAWWDAQREFQRCPEGVVLQLDKDLFGVWGRLYGPDRCALLPKPINRLMTYYFDLTKGIKQREDGKWYLTSRKYRRLVARNEFSTITEAYFARLDVIRSEVIAIATPLRDMFSDRVWQQLVNGYWDQLRHYHRNGIEAALEVERQSKEDLAKNDQ